MGGSSKSVNKNTTNTSTVHETNTANTSLQGEGNIHGSDNTIITNAADAEVLRSLGADAFSAASDLGNGSFDLSLELGQGAFDLAGAVNRDNVGFMGSIGQSLISAASKTQSESLSLAEEATRNSMGLVSNFTERQQLGASAGQADALKWVALAAVAVVGFSMMRGRK